MSISRLVKFLVFVFALLASGSVMSSVLAFRASGRLERAQEQRMVLYVAVQTLQSTSEDLTRWVRSFAATGDQSAYDAFNQEIAVVMRKEGVVAIFDDPAMSTDDERELVARAVSRSYDLVAFEAEAFEAARSGDFERATAIVYSDGYESIRIEIMAILYELRGLVDARTLAYQEDARVQSNYFEVLAVATAVLFGLVSIGSILLILYKVSATHRIAAIAIDVANGNLTAQVNPRDMGNDEIGLLFGAFSEILSSLRTLRAKFQEMDFAVRSGRTHFRITGSQDLKGCFQDMIDTTNFVLEDYEYSLDLIPEPFIVLNNDLEIMHTNVEARKVFGLADDCNDNVGVRIFDDIANHPATARAIESRKKSLEADFVIQIRGSERHYEYNCIPFDSGDGHEGVVTLLTDITSIVEAQNAVQRRTEYHQSRSDGFKKILVDSLESGNLMPSFPKDQPDTGLLDLSQKQDSIEDAVEGSLGRIRSYVDEISAQLREFADKNFSMNISREYVGDFAAIKESIGMIIDSVSSLISEIQTATKQVELGAAQIAQANQGLMESFSEQTEAANEIKNAIDILTDETTSNVREAESSKEISQAVQSAADEGTRHMSELSHVMGEIKTSSSEIAKIASVLESIAFQTNLLALNAAVEAARSGEHGRGFTVVAEEVRVLASRSAEAAKETSDMIARSIAHVNEGVEKSEQTAQALRSIAEMTVKSSERIAHIAVGSASQAEEIGKIQNSMQSVYQSLTNDQAAVAHTASVSEELSSQAVLLRSMVEQFSLEARG